MPQLPVPSHLGLPEGSIIALPGNGEVLYRLLGRSQPRSADFRSNRDKGRPPMPRETALLRCGVSMFESAEAARSRSRRVPVFVAAITLEPGQGFSLAKTGSPGHYTIWGEPDALAARARAD